MLQEAYDLGVRINGENKAQELASKYEVLPKDIHWHMIGHMQRNKVKYIIDKVDLIHSVDSVRLAETIDKEAEKHGVIANILIEVNVAKEESKFGLMPEEVPEFVEKIADFLISRKGINDNCSICRKSRRKQTDFCTFKKIIC